MNEQTPETAAVDITVNDEAHSHRFHFTRKQIAITSAATAAVVLAVWLKVKSSAKDDSLMSDATDDADFLESLNTTPNEQ